MSNSGINPKQLLDHVVRPALQAIGRGGRDAEALVMGTAAQESAMGRYLHQVGGGPAVGIFQMEPATHDDIWQNYVRYRPDLADVLNALIVHEAADPPKLPEASQMAWNLRYAAAMCRIHYLRSPSPLPAFDDVEGQALYWKREYNTEHGAGASGEYIRHFNLHLGELAKEWGAAG